MIPWWIEILENVRSLIFHDEYHIFIKRNVVFYLFVAFTQILGKKSSLRFHIPWSDSKILGTTSGEAYPKKFQTNLTIFTLYSPLPSYITTSLMHGDTRLLVWNKGPCKELKISFSLSFPKLAFFCIYDVLFLFPLSFYILVTLSYKC